MRAYRYRMAGAADPDEEIASIARGPRTTCPACGARHDAYNATIETVWVPKAWHRPDGDYLRQRCVKCGAVWRRLPLETEVMG